MPSNGDSIVDLALRPPGTFTRKAKRPFSGILMCGVCGGGISIHDRKGGAIRIRCSTARESGSCPNTGYFRLDRIEQASIKSENCWKSGGRLPALKGQPEW
jgi:hypothetical protein